MKSTTTSSSTFVLRSTDHYISRARSWQSTSHAKKIRLQANTIACKSGISISDHAWSCYAEFRALRKEGRELQDNGTEEQFTAYDKNWYEFTASDRFGAALCVDRFVHQVDHWEWD